MTIFLRLILLIIAAQFFGLTGLQAQLPPLIPNYQNGKGGYSDSTGTMIVPAIYDRTYLLRNGIGMVMRYADNPEDRNKPLELFGLYDSTGRMIYPPQSANQPNFHKTEYIIVSRRSDRSTLYGLIDRQGNSLLPTEYKHYRSYRHGFLYFRKTDSSEIIHLNDGSTRKYTLSRNFKEFKAFQDQALFTVKTWSGNVGVIDGAGRMLIDTIYQRLHPVDFGFIVAEAHAPYTTKAGVLNARGDTIVPLNYPKINILGPQSLAGVQHVARDFNRIDLYDNNGRLLTKHPVQTADSIGFGRILTERFGDVVSVRADGRTFTTTQWDNPRWHGFASVNPLYPDFRSGYAAVSDSLGRTTYIDVDGNPYTWPDGIQTLIDEYRIHSISRFKHGWTDFRRNDSCGLISADGRVMLFGMFDAFSPFGNDQFVAVKNFEDYTNPEKIDYRSECWLVDTNGQFINGEPWSMCYPLHDGRALFSPRYGSSYGYLDARGVEIIPAHFEYARSFSEGLAVVKFIGSSHFGAIDNTGMFVVPARYDNMRTFNNGRAAVQREGLWTLVDRGGHELHAPTIKYITSFEHGMLCGKIDRDTVVCLNREGEEIIRMAGAEIEIMSARRIAVDSTRLFNNEGVEILAHRFEAVRHVTDSILAVRIDGMWQLADLSGDILSPTHYDDIRPFVGELASVRRGMWTIIDRQLNEVVRPQFERVEHIDNTHALGRRANEVQLRGRDNNILATWRDTTLLYKRLYYARTAVRYNGKVGVIDTNGRMIMPMVFDGMAPKATVCNRNLLFLRDNLTFLYRNGYGQAYDSLGMLIAAGDSTGQVCLTRAYQVCRFIGNDTEHFQIFDRRNDVWSQETWTDCGPAGWNIAIANAGDQFGLFNNDGTRLGDGLYEEVVSVRKSAVIVKRDGKYGALDLNGNVLIELIYDYVGTLRDSLPVFFQLAKDDKRFVADANGTILATFDGMSGIVMAADDMLIVRRRSGSRVARLDGTFIAQKAWDNVSEVSPGLFTCSNSGEQSILLDKYGRIYHDGKSLRR